MNDRNEIPCIQITLKIVIPNKVRNPENRDFKPFHELPYGTLARPMVLASVPNQMALVGW